MGDILKFPPLDDDAKRDFIVDMARFADGLLDQQAIRKKYRFDDSAWERLGKDDELVEAIEAEKARRIRNGATARERAQVLYARVPTVLGGILDDDHASPRHRIESAKEIRAVAANGPEAAPASDRFQITIILNSDVERYDKSIAIDPNDIDPNHIDTGTTGELAAITARKDDDGGGESV